MSLPVPQPLPAPAGTNAGAVLVAHLRTFPGWIVHRLPTVLAGAIGAGVVGYVVNVWLMAARYDGYVVPGGSAATGEGNFLQGGLFWALLTTFGFSVVGYRRAVGGPRFWRDVRGLPRGLSSLVRADGGAARVHLLWGAAGGMAASLLIGPSLGIVLSAGVLVAAPTIIGNVLSSAAYKVVNGVLGKVSPTTPLSPQTGMLSTAVSLLGSAAALGAAFLITDTTVKLVLALACAAGAFALGQQRRQAPPAAAVLVVLGAAIVAGADMVLSVSAVWADDGGYIECGSSWSQWWSECAGSGTVRVYAGVGATAAAGGSAVGSFVGELVGEAALEGNPDGGDPELASWVEGLLGDPAYDDFRSQFPDIPTDPAGFEQYIGWRQQQGLEIPPLPDGWTWDTGDTGAESPESTGVTTAEVKDEGGAKFEGMEGWSGEPDSEPDDLAGFDEAIDEFEQGLEDDFDEFEQDLEGEPSEGEGEPSEGEGEPSEGEGEPSEGEGEPSEGEGEPGEGEGEPSEGEGEPSEGEGEPEPEPEPEGEPGEGEAEPGEPEGEGEPEPESEGEPSEGEGEPDEGEGEPSEGEPDEGEGEPSEGEPDEGEGEPGEGEAEPGEPQGEPEGEGEGEGEPEPEPESEPEGEGEPGEGDETEGDETEGEPGEGDETEGEQPPIPPESGEGTAPHEEASEGEGEGEEGDKPTKLRVPDEEIDRGHEVQPDRVAEGPDGRPLVDPETGKPLAVDQDGNVRYGDGWMSPEEAAERTALDDQWRAERAEGQRLVEEFRDLQSQLDRATDPATRAELEAQLRQTALEINENYQAKAELKAEGRTATTTAYDERVQAEYGRVDQDFVDRMNEMGIQRGGRDFNADDLKDIRNASSAGTAGMDRDLALQQARTRELADRLAAAEPGSPEARALAQELRTAQAAERMTIDYDRCAESLRSQLADAPAGSGEAQRLQSQLDRLEADGARIKADYLSQLSQQLERAPAGSPEASRIQAEIAAAEGRMAGRAQVDLSPGRWNDLASPAYEGSYRNVTGGDAERAFQGVTQAGNPEAYRNMAVLANDPTNRPFAPEWAGQTADVTGYKVDHLNHLVEEGVITRAAADQEIARGVAKDLNTKLLPELRSDPGADPAKVSQMERMADVLTRAGRGEIPPGQVDQALRAAVPEIPGLDVDKAVSMTTSNLEAATKWRGEMGGPDRVPGAEGAERVGTPEGPGRTGAPEGPGRTGVPDAGPRGMGAMGTLSDAATIQHYTEQNIARGMDPLEAALVATAQTQAGNAAMASGVADPRSSMLGQALLPNELRGALPDAVVENFAGTGYEGGRAAVESLSTSIQEGRLNTDAIDRFAENVANRQGTDPFQGYASASQLAGEEMARTDGGNVVSDLRQIYKTGVGAEMANQSMEDFASSVERGEHGAPLQGLAHLTKIACEAGVDPSTTMSEFVNDLRTIYENGVGEGYWSEAVDTTADVIARTPLLGTVQQGYNEIASGIGEHGVGGFAEEMYEGGKAWASETAGQVADSTGRAIDWARSWF